MEVDFGLAIGTQRQLEVRALERNETRLGLILLVLFTFANKSYLEVLLGRTQGALIRCPGWQCLEMRD